MAAPGTRSGKGAPLRLVGVSVALAAVAAFALAGASRLRGGGAHRRR